MENRLAILTRDEQERGYVKAWFEDEEKHGMTKGGKTSILVPANYWDREREKVRVYLSTGTMPNRVSNLHVNYCYAMNKEKVICPFCQIPFDGIGHEGKDGFNFEHESDEGVSGNCPANGDNDAIFCTYKEGKFYLNTYSDDTPNSDITNALSIPFKKLFERYIERGDD